MLSHKLNKLIHLKGDYVLLAFHPKQGVPGTFYICRDAICPK